MLSNAWVTEGPNGVNGYIFIHSHAGEMRLGPWYHPNVIGAAHLFSMAVEAAKQVVIRLHIPEGNIKAKAIVSGCGFLRSGATTRMISSGKPPGNMEAQYAVASLATG